jgi:hypothetical protein
VRRSGCAAQPEKSLPSYDTSSRNRIVSIGLLVDEKGPAP